MSMKFHIFTIFPEMFEGPLSNGIIARAIKNELIEVRLVNIRKYAQDKRGTIDDYPFGGGSGMIMKPEPLFEAVEDEHKSGSLKATSKIILLSPQGRRLTQAMAEDLAKLGEIAMICGRYEGVDERVRKHLATDEISIGDYVLGGGELASMVVVDTVSRLIPGVVGSIESVMDDSFTTGLLQHPQYTRPSEFRKWQVPPILLSGNHAEISRWKRRESIRRTFLRRRELLNPDDLSEDELTFIEGLEKNNLG